MTDVGISNVDFRFTQYAHEFSAGIRQRMMIAMAWPAVRLLLLQMNQPLL